MINYPLFGICFIDNSVFLANLHFIFQYDLEQIEVAPGLNLTKDTLV